MSKRPVLEIVAPVLAQSMLIAVLATMSGHGIAHAGAGEAIAAVYDVEISGLKALRIRYDVEVSRTGYRSRLAIETRGLAAVFSDYHMDMAASGAFVGGQAEPANFSSLADKKNRTKSLKVSWSGDGLLRQHQPADKDLRIQTEIDAALTGGVADPLTAIIRLGGGKAGEPCQRMQRVFSGQDVYDLRFSYQGKAVIGSGSEGVYRGPAYECRVVYLPVAGRSANKFRKNKSVPPTFRVWFAPVQSAALGGAVLMPVAATGTLDGRKFVAYASRATIAGRPFNEFSQAED
jgi:hypothetical protein